MRDFLISSLNNLVSIIVVLTMIGAVLGALTILNDPQAPYPTVSALAVLIGGFVSTVVFGGSVFLLIGIYENSKRTADALEKQAL